MKPVIFGCVVNLFASVLAAQSTAPFNSMPLYFEACNEKVDSSAQFIARGRGYQFCISPVEAQITLRKSATQPATVRMQFVGANKQAQINGNAELPGKINYLTGNDPANWRSGVRTFARVNVGELYPGIGLVYYGNQQQLEYDFAIAPDADPDMIKIHFDGVDRISIGEQGELVLALGNAEIRQPKPVIYQTVGGMRKEISGGYRIMDAYTVAFTVGKYDRSLPLVIDPILSYSTYFGGTSGETAWAVALDANGFVYIAGQTLSKQLYTNGPSFSTTGAFQTNFQGGKVLADAFVAKFDSLGTNLIYLTYIGGNDDDVVHGLAVDGAGNAYLAGTTDSTNFPTTTNALYRKIAGKINPNIGHYPPDVFVAELNTNGSELIYSTYFGGSQADGANDIAVDSAGNAYVTGATFSTNFPTTNAISYHLACANTYFNANAFITKIGPGGSPLIYSSYFGGTNFDEGKGIAVDSSNYVYVTGYTFSTNFPTFRALTNGLHLNGSTNKTSIYNDAFVAKFDPTGTNLVYSTFLGGLYSDVAYHIAVDNQGAAYVAGYTTSPDFPSTAANIIPSAVSNNAFYGYPVITNAFLTKITNGPTAAGIDYSAVFGGTRIDIANDVAVDPAGNAFVIGSTSSTNFPLVPTNAISGLRATNAGGFDAFVTAFYAGASNVIYSLYLGGKGNDYGYGIAVDPDGNAYIVGQTASTNFPVTTNAWRTVRNGTNDAFLAIILLNAPSQPQLRMQGGNGNIKLSWRNSQPGYTLEFRSGLASPQTWVTVPQSPILSNGWKIVTLPATNGMQLFRLHKP